MTDALFLLDPDHDDVPLDADGLDVGWRLTLPTAVRRHAVQAMRLGAGDELQLSDGRGLRVAAVLRDPDQGVAEVRAFTREPRPVTRLTLIQALAKNGRDEQAIDMATQIGVDAVIPWQADRSIAKWKAGRTDRKWRQTLDAATEQSRRSWRPELGECVTSKGVVSEILRSNVHGGLVIVLHQDATDTWSSIESLVDALAGRCVDDGRPRSIAVVVGPEGGIADAEVEAFRDAGAHVCVLGHTILRASAAGPVALSLLSRALGRYA
ncbi:16S rRNA (uracil(1498)-N(3))-methyltransferase [Bifidobacterium pullorum subsp. saeculare]|uniref:Ribosomal RNA small subunit methyltransferase E n=1 Tax=Bifidobacterium pullorum subsp. saeculare TaxID=78257 RepID=A0A938WYK7_9BIFI|nr:16S rRNA (uracil(1498)-N(3))-methyltransferase [Bifidobacterium pullorum]MBM6699398.1 16S rRNA (uracil(1498)-N(3))-methyltransferase [Bifidobacterium pullorum subsp. saeculare]